MEFSRQEYWSGLPFLSLVIAFLFHNSHSKWCKVISLCDLILTSLMVARLSIFSCTFWLFVWASLLAQMVKHLSRMRETRVRSLGWEDPLEKEMAIHSSTIAWKIPWTEEPGRLQSMGSLRAGHDWVTSLSLFTFMHWRRKWQPTPVFLPGESHGWRSLVGCGPWGC